MATAQVCFLFVLLSLSLAQDVKLKYKPAAKPVRLFTEEELQRYDGTEVNLLSFFTVISPQCIPDYVLRVHCTLPIRNAPHIFRCFTRLFQEGQPIYMAVKGVVFDVSKGKGI